MITAEVRRLNCVISFQLVFGQLNPPRSCSDGRFQFMADYSNEVLQLLLRLLCCRLTDLSTDVCRLPSMNDHCGKCARNDEGCNIRQIFQGIIVENLCHRLNIEIVNYKET